MTHIIAGGLQQQKQVEDVMNELKRVGFRESEITSFYLNPPGQHDLLPIGGDRIESPGTNETAEGNAMATTGAGAVGAIVGLVGVPAFGLVAPALGAAVGSYVGSLVGGVAQMEERDETNNDGTNNIQKEPYEQRNSGMIVGVNVIDDNEEQIAIKVLRAFGAKHIEKSQTKIVNGNWINFDPIGKPVLIEA